MRDGDVGELRSFLPGVREIVGPVRTVAVLSPAGGELDLVSELLCPADPPAGLPISAWNVRDPCPGSYDLILAANVFMAVPDPGPAIGNALRACRCFVLLDHCVSFRGGGGREIGVPADGDPTPDCMRFTMPPEMSALLDGAYDLNVHRDRLLLFRTFKPVANGVSFLGAWRGAGCKELQR